MQLWSIVVICPVMVSTKQHCQSSVKFSELWVKPLSRKIPQQRNTLYFQYLWSAVPHPDFCACFLRLHTFVSASCFLKLFPQTEMKSKIHFALQLSRSLSNSFTLLSLFFLKLEGAFVSLGRPRSSSKIQLFQLDTLALRASQKLKLCL